MPNGIDKNWYRLCGALDGFRTRFGSWPTRIRLPVNSIEYLFKAETLVRLGERIQLVYDGSPFIAEDDRQRSFSYAQEGFIEKPPISAHEWLGVNPDSDLANEYPHAPGKDEG